MVLGFRVAQRHNNTGSRHCVHQQQRSEPFSLCLLLDIVALLPSSVCFLFDYLYVHTVYGCDFCFNSIFPITFHWSVVHQSIDHESLIHLIEPRCLHLFFLSLLALFNPPLFSKQTRILHWYDGLVWLGSRLVWLSGMTGLVWLSGMTGLVWLSGMTVHLFHSQYLVWIWSLQSLLVQTGLLRFQTL